MKVIKLMMSVFFVSILSTFYTDVFAQKVKKDNEGLEERAVLVQALIKIADPVLTALSKNELRLRMPVECHKGMEEDRKNYTYLEAFGRLLSGMAPWLELGADDTPEGKLREKYISLAQIGLKNATDPKSADFMNFSTGSQPLVDAAFLSEALIRAPKHLWDPLDQQTKNNIIKALKTSRKIKASESNWLLFSAMVEAALLKFDGGCDQGKIDYAIKQHMAWYKGDGVYGDGLNFHWDYYNSFVIQPMLLGVLQTCIAAGQDSSVVYQKILNRSIRYAEVQERLIAADGTYPPLGRSLAYRFGAFHLLSKIALMRKLPADKIAPEQVRSALYTVISHQLAAKGTFDDQGWLQIGFYGHQPEIGETYISTGSLYLCSEAFLILGLPESDPFWTGGSKPWTQKKAWSGAGFAIDQATD
ncbi:MAG: DUF2264 domain-containing protein [Sphingobacteriaceae bacterium]